MRSVSHARRWCSAWRCAASWSAGRSVGSRPRSSMAIQGAGWLIWSGTDQCRAFRSPSKAWWISRAVQPASAKRVSGGVSLRVGTRSSQPMRCWSASARERARRCRDGGALRVFLVDARRGAAFFGYERFLRNKLVGDLEREPSLTAGGVTSSTVGRVRKEHRANSAASRRWLLPRRQARRRSARVMMDLPATSSTTSPSSLSADRPRCICRVDICRAVTRRALVGRQLRPVRWSAQRDMARAMRTTVAGSTRCSRQTLRPVSVATAHQTSMSTQSAADHHARCRDAAPGQGRTPAGIRWPSEAASSGPRRVASGELSLNAQRDRCDSACHYRAALA